MHILVTNDDGVHAPGLLALAQAMRQIGQVTVFAPDRNWSASGHVKTLERPIRVTETILADGTPALMSDGAPSDCVALPLLGYVDKVDLVVSGINPFSEASIRNPMPLPSEMVSRPHSSASRFNVPA